jgi:elongation factor G
MREYKVDKLRNVALVGHGGCGKTSLSEAMLYDAGATSRLGKVEDKNTVSDYDEEEQSRGFSVNTSILPAEWRDTKLNILDAPGYTDFVGEVKAAIRAADGAVLVVCAASGVEVGAELHWSFLDEANLPRIVFINKLDRDNASFSRTIEELKAPSFRGRSCPLALPIGAQASFKGIVDLVSMKAYTSVEGQESDIPADMQDEAAEARTQMMEYAAEADDDLMMKYLEGEELTNDELREALAVGSRRGDLVLVMAGSATQNLGPRRLLDAVVDYLPSPTDRVVEAQNAATEEPVEIKADAAGPLVVQVFKTLADPFVGKLTYFRVFSGTL